MAIIKTSPFKKGKAKSKPNITTPKISNDSASLADRHRLRKCFDLESIELRMHYETNNPAKPFYSRDFSLLVQRFPHHEELIKQFLMGVAMSIGKRKAAFQSFQSAAHGIEQFVEFLNSDEPRSSKVFCFADISFAVVKAFHSWILRTFPGRTTNRKIFGSVRKAVFTVQNNYSKNPRIGPPSSWPPGPRQNEMVSESYSTTEFNRFVDCCLMDINYIISRMSEFSQTMENTPRFIDNDGVLPNWRKSQAIRTKSSLTLEQTERMAFSTAYKMYPNWPLGMNIDEATRVFSIEEAKSNFNVMRAEEKARRIIISTRFGSDEPPMAIGQLAYFSHFVFCGNSLYPFFLFVQLNTGWNLESVIALTSCINDHLEQDIMDEHYCIIYSTKERTQQTVTHRSNMKSPHSVYSILKFVEYQITKFKDSPHYLPGKLWQFIAAKNLWRKHNKILSNLDYGNIHHLSNNFLDRHNIDLGLDSKEPSIEARRIRTTWATKRREQGLSTEAMMGLMGHVDIDTTAKHYDNDNGSNNLKNQQLRGLQNRHLDDFQNYHVRLAQATTLSELREAIANAGSKSIAYEAVASKLGMKNSLDVVHLLSPAGQTYIAACTNSFEPSWKDARNHISNGEQCRFFNRCCMCDKAVIFKESLPWIARRINDLEALRLKIPAPEWALNYGTELSGWEWVMTSWNNPDDVAEAKVLSTLNKFSLPLTMVAKPEKPSPVDVLWEKL